MIRAVIVTGLVFDILFVFRPEFNDPTCRGSHFSVFMSWLLLHKKSLARDDCGIVQALHVIHYPVFHFFLGRMWCRHIVVYFYISVFYYSWNCHKCDFYNYKWYIRRWFQDLVGVYYMQLPGNHSCDNDYWRIPIYWGREILSYSRWSMQICRRSMQTVYADMQTVYADGLCLSA